MRFSIVDFLVSRLDVPLTPRSDYRHFRSESLDGELKSHLVVALTGAAVRDGVGAFGLRDLDESLRDAGTRVRGAEEVVLILCVSLQAGPDVILYVVLLEVLDIELGRAGLESLFLKSVEFGSLSDVGTYGDDFAVVVVFLEPRNDDRGVKTSGVRENDFLYVFLVHFCYLTFHIMTGVPLFCFRRPYVFLMHILYAYSEKNTRPILYNHV